MFCKYCGYEYQNDDAVFCPSCGKKLKEESVAINNANTVTNQPKATYYNLGSLCMQYGHKSKYCDFGCPIDPVTISKHVKLIEAMKINNNDQIYYLHHEYVINSLTTGLLHGFAICGSGIYTYGSGNDSESCYIKKNDDYFVYSNNELPDDEEYQILREECIFVFVGKENDTFVIMENINGSGNIIYHLEDDVIIGVYLETEFFGKYNGKYLSLIKDTSFDINICAVTADSNVAEFMYNFFIGVMD